MLPVALSVLVCCGPLSLKLCNVNDSHAKPRDMETLGVHNWLFSLSALSEG